MTHKQNFLQNALPKINSNDFLADLVKIPSVSGNEEEISKYLISFLEKHNFHILKSSVGNAVGIYGNGHPVLLLASHMDTVSTKNPFMTKDGKLYGTGAVDCKASLASMFYAFRDLPLSNSLEDNQHNSSIVNTTDNTIAASTDNSSASIDSSIDSSKNNLNSNIKKKYFNGTLILAAIVHEEDDVIGIEDLFNVLSSNNITPDYAIFGEPTNYQRICIGYRGRVALKIKIKTEPVHAACSWGSDNVIEIFYSLYDELRNFSEEYNREHNPKNSKFRELTVNLTQLHSGDTFNSLPRDGWATFDIRIPPGLKSNKFVEEARNIINKVQENCLNPATTIFLEGGAVYDAVEAPPGVLITNSLRWAIFKETGSKAQMLQKTGSTFTNIIQTHYGQKNPEFHCITYGPGDSRLEHTDNEFIELDEYNRVISIYKRFLPKFEELYNRKKRN